MALGFTRGMLIIAGARTGYELGGCRFPTAKLLTRLKFHKNMLCVMVAATICGFLLLFDCLFLFVDIGFVTDSGWISEIVRRTYSLIADGEFISLLLFFNLGCL